ncbi:MAG: cation:proton antiporter [Pseudomonadota bacterium]
MNGYTGLFDQLLILLGASVVLIVLLHRLGIPSILAFLVIGAACGPGGLALVSSSSGIHAVAEFGVVFLLFTLGLEFSLPRLIALRNTVFGIGSLQVLLCGGLFFAALRFAGLEITASIVIAGGLALSSTAIVSRELVTTGQLHTRHGQVSIGILLFQDIAAVFLLIMLPVLAGTNTDNLVTSIAGPLLRGTLLFFAMIAAGRWLLPRLLEETARTRSEELFMLAALLVALVAAWLTQLAGLSMALGAFLAGMLLGESRFRHQIESDIRPFRDLLLGLFFISIGLMIDVAMLREYWPRIIVFGLILVAIKGTLIALMTRALRETGETSIRTGLALAQGGEFFFALLALAASERIVPADVASFMIAITVVSMTVTPLLLGRSEAIANWLLPRLPRRRTAPTDTTPEINQLIAVSTGLNQHVIILGYGRVGQTIARFLRLQQIAFVALDTDVVRVREATIAGDNLFFGDPLRRDMLHAAGIARAALVIVSFDHVPGALRIIGHARELRADVPILVRTRDDHGLAELQAAGATEVIPETLEASLMLVSHVFLLLGVAPHDIQRLLEQTRRQRYQLLHGYYEGTYDRLQLQQDDKPDDVLHAVPLPPHATAIGRTLTEFDTGTVEVRAVRRDGVTHQSPAGDWLLAPGDTLILAGSHTAVIAAEERLLDG